MELFVYGVLIGASILPFWSLLSLSIEVVINAISDYDKRRFSKNQH